MFQSLATSLPPPAKSGLARHRVPRSRPQSCTACQSRSTSCGGATSKRPWLTVRRPSAGISTATRLPSPRRIDVWRAGYEFHAARDPGPSCYDRHSRNGSPGHADECPTGDDAQRPCPM